MAHYFNYLTRYYDKATHELVVVHPIYRWLQFVHCGFCFLQLGVGAQCILTFVFREKELSPLKQAAYK